VAVLSLLPASRAGHAIPTATQNSQARWEHDADGRRRTATAITAGERSGRRGLLHQPSRTEGVNGNGRKHRIGRMGPMVKGKRGRPPLQRAPRRGLAGSRSDRAVSVVSGFFSKTPSFWMACRSGSSGWLRPPASFCVAVGPAHRPCSGARVQLQGSHSASSLARGVTRDSASRARASVSRSRISRTCAMSGLSAVCWRP